MITVINIATAIIASVNITAIITTLTVITASMIVTTLINFELSLGALQSQTQGAEDLRAILSGSKGSLRSWGTPETGHCKEAFEETLENYVKTPLRSLLHRHQPYMTAATRPVREKKKKKTSVLAQPSLSSHPSQDSTRADA